MRSNKVALDPRAVFIQTYGSNLPSDGDLVKDCLSLLGGNATALHGGSPTTGAMSNTRGRWFEWLLAIFAWNYSRANPDRPMLVKLPSVSSFNFSDLYSSDLSGMVKHLRDEVKKHAVGLVTSNPDFAIIRLSDEVALPLDLGGILTGIGNGAVLDGLDKLYKCFIGMCEFGDVEGYVSAKASLRPDRRLQIAHEGSLVKALYAHLQTRLWVTSPNGLKYYAVAMEVTEADRAALTTIATHSIPNVNSVPQRAVDEVFEVKYISDIKDVLKSILG